MRWVGDFGTLLELLSDPPFRFGRVSGDYTMRLSSKWANARASQVLVERTQACSDQHLNFDAPFFLSHLSSRNDTLRVGFAAFIFTHEM
ncbi:hypothetical protein JAAARDRAFT_631803 [Jaapia argillacea MUCL 33604]|uniref:Uncharacterized protein n=1 Tax=Jaapia argillacea MUCL 33604 TaxID=933084 RepID=A0A067Q8C8_9AGAM|nr:hypothetical protein JAAARDRAFT_631803 [Jaapia argillacea MUCL 33604]